MNNTNRSYFKRALLKTLLIPAGLGIALGALFFVQVRYLVTMSERVERSDRIVSTLHQVSSLFMEARIRHQHDQVPARPPYHPNYDPDHPNPLEKIQPALGSLENWVASDPVQSQNVSRLRQILREWRQLEATPRAASASVRYEAFRRSEAVALRFQNLVASLEDFESRLRAQRMDLAQEANRLVTSLSIVLTILLGVSVGFFTRGQLVELDRSYNDALSAVELQAKNLESANKAKNLFLANMSHEMRTPLSAIMGFTNIALGANPSSPELPNALQVVRRNSEHLHKLINDLLDISRIEAGHLQIEKAKVPLAPLFDEVWTNFRRSLQEKNLSFRVVSGAGIPEALFTDSLRLGQILTNLVGNAIKFTRRGEVRIELELERGTSVAGKLLLRVCDTGEGIPLDRTTQLFQPFVQVDDSEHRRYTGTGLGLAISRQLARALGGDLILERSAPGVGSVFRLTLPVELAPTPPLTPPLKALSNAETPVAKPLAGMQVLVAEDSPDLQVLVRRFLEAVGARVEVVPDGVEVVQAARRREHDVILMDIHMPRQGGLSATRELRELGHEEPILALTAHASEEERQRCLEAGCDDHISKPVNPELIVERILRLTANSADTRKNHDERMGA